MPSSVLTVDGQTRLDTDLTLEVWAPQRPEALTDLVAAAKNRSEPYLKSALLALMDALTTHTPVQITINTRADGWTMTVNHTHAHTAALSR